MLTPSSTTCGRPFSAAASAWGLTVLFRERLNHQGRLAKDMAASAYGVYLIHVPVSSSPCNIRSALHPWPFDKVSSRCDCRDTGRIRHQQRVEAPPSSRGPSCRRRETSFSFSGVGTAM